MPSALPSTVTCHRILGTTCSGKTAALLSLAQDALREQQGSVVFIASDEQAAQYARSRCVDTADRISIMTPNQLAIHVLDRVDCRKLYSRPAVILNEFEQAIFFEDMKTVGIKQRRLREMLAFFERGFSDLSADDPDWLVTAEEKTVMDTMQRILACSGGMLPSEASRFALNALAQGQTTAEDVGFDVMLVDDFDLLGHATQLLTQVCARHSFTFTANTGLRLASAEPFPYPDGIALTKRDYPQAEETVLTCCNKPAGIERAISSIRERMDVEDSALVTKSCLEGNSDVTVLKAATITDSLAQVCTECHDAADEGKTVAVVTTNRLMSINLQRALTTVGLEAKQLKACRKHSFRTSDDNSTVARELLGQLHNDPRSAVTWRSWLALGDETARSASVHALRNASDHLDLIETLEQVDAEKVVLNRKDAALAARGLSRYREGLEALRGYAGAEPIPQNDEPTRRGSVFIGSPEELFSQHVDVVVFAGFVDGLIPSREFVDPGVVVGSSRTRQHRQALQQVLQCAAAAEERLVFSCFSECTLEVAEHLDIHIERIFLRDGVRACEVHPSCLLRELGLLDD